MTITLPYSQLFIYVQILHTPRTAHYSTPLIEDGNTLELFTLDLHCARIHREKLDIAVKNIEILILAA
jgi:hypothetical protein